MRESEELQIPCSICIYIATCELSWHIEDEHDIKTDIHFERDFPCKIFKWCRTNADLTYHLKKHESDRLPCESQSLVNESVMMSCNFCDIKFETKNDLMIHKKKEHSKKEAIIIVQETVSLGTVLVGSFT